MQEYFDHEEVKRFFKFATLAIVLLSVFLLAKSLDALRDWRAPQAAYSTIVVTGSGEAYAAPDIATFSFSVSADAATVAAAQESVTKKTDAILAKLDEMGIEDKDIRTTDYSFYPKYKYVPTTCTNGYCPGNQVPDGYTLSHTVTVKVRNIDDAGKALGVVADNGATNVSSLVLTLDNPDSIYNEARSEAVEKARQKAKDLAESLGVSLGRVVDFADSSYVPSPYYAREMGGMGGGVALQDAKAPTLPGGQNTFTSNVTITYEIR